MAGRPGSGFGALWRVRTRKHVRTVRSILTSTGPGGTVYRDEETARLRVEEERLEAWQAEHEKRRAIQWLLNDR
ncbi:MAG: hypothetical protein Q7U96_02795 [Chloroflexota bacterium]|nr:hypothetical protein [Chloroflexota bacterium]